MISESFRVEKDSLGELHVPTEALYGAQTQRAVENFPVSGLRPWRAFVWSMATIKRAAAEVNRSLGLSFGADMPIWGASAREPGRCRARTSFSKISAS